jgi:hypothetical protein
MAAPLVPHWRAAVDVLRYLSATRECGINFSGRGTLKLQAWCDSDCGGDLETRRSTTGYLFTLGGGAVSWQSRLQPTVAA